MHRMFRVGEPHILFAAPAPDFLIAASASALFSKRLWLLLIYFKWLRIKEPKTCGFLRLQL